MGLARPLPENESLRKFIEERSPYVSAVSYVEVLGYHSLTPEDHGFLQQFFEVAALLPISQEILDVAVTLRQKRNISLGDSLIAGTALVYKLELATRNTDGFDWIEGLKVFDPLG